MAESYGLFGPKGYGGPGTVTSNESYDCGMCCLDGCHGPDTLYMGFEHLGDYFYAPMMRLTAFLSRQCECDECYQPLFWSTGLLHFRDDDAPGDPETEVCCMGVWLNGRCVAGVCEWTITLLLPLDGSKNSVRTFVSCNPIDSGPQNFTFERGECIQDNDNNDNRMTMTISESQPTGTLLEECHNMCCPAPETLYVTFDAPECPWMDGRVVELKGATAFDPMNIDGLDPNAYGEASYVWQGYLHCDCGLARLCTLLSNTWSGDVTECNYTLKIDGSLAGPEDGCFSDALSSESHPYCFPLVFTDEMGDLCDCCDVSGADITATVTA